MIPWIRKTGFLFCCVFRLLPVAGQKKSVTPGLNNRGVHRICGIRSIRSHLPNRGSRRIVFPVWSPSDKSGPGECIQHRRKAAFIILSIDKPLCVPGTYLNSSLRQVNIVPCTYDPHLPLSKNLYIPPAALLVKKSTAT